MFIIVCGLHVSVLNGHRQALLWIRLWIRLVAVSCTRHGHQHRVTVTRGCIYAICLSWWWARGARNM